MTISTALMTTSTTITTTTSAIISTNSLPSFHLNLRSYWLQMTLAMPTNKNHPLKVKICQ